MVLGQTSTTDLIFSMKMVLEKSWKFNSESYTTFLDLEKAFDHVPRDKLSQHSQAMRKVEYTIPPSLLLKAIKGMYRKCRSSVRTARGLGLWFEVKTGVRRGSVLSPLLFVLLMDLVMKQAEVKIQEVERDDVAFSLHMRMT